MPRQRFRLSASVFMLLCRDDAVLCLRRAGTGWMDGFWSVPAGGLDGGETLLEAARRETREEVGVEVAAADARLVHMLHCRTAGEEWLGAVFAAERWRGEPCLREPAKHDRLAWHAAAALPDATIPYVRQAVGLGLAGIAWSAYGWDYEPPTELA